MKAWQSTTTHEPLSLTEVPAWLSVLAKTPITMGHENACVVAAVGEGPEPTPALPPTPRSSPRAGSRPETP